MKRIVLALALAAAPVAAQERPPVPPDSVPGADSVPDRRQRGDSVRPRPPVSPSGAFLRSLIIPGWGQARLNRNVTGGLFVAWEAVAAAMVWKTQWQLEWARMRNKFVKEHTQEREDWIVLLAFNHLLAATEAYVSAHLYDFPVALKVERLPGETRFGLSIPLR